MFAALFLEINVFKAGSKSKILHFLEWISNEQIGQELTIVSLSNFHIETRWWFRSTLILLIKTSRTGARNSN